MTDSRRVTYDAAVMARLRFPMPDPASDDDDIADAVRDDIWQQREQYARELTEGYNELVTSSYLAADSDGSAPGPAPSVVATELGLVSARLKELEEYRDRLIVYARSLASTPVPARAVAASTEMSHSTIVRMATAEAIADIAVEASPAAADVLQDFDPREDPQFYLRLQYAANADRDGAQ